MAKPRAPDPGTFEHLLTPVRVPVAALVRLSRYPATEPYWACDRAHRFDDPLPPARRDERFGVLYCARDFDTAFCESVIHENSLFVGGRYQVSEASLARHIVTFQPRAGGGKSLRLADFADAALKRMGLNLDLTSGDDYEPSQAWARAVWEHDTGWDGIRYRSRQRGNRFAYALFDRCAIACASYTPLQGAALTQLLDKYHVECLPDQDDLDLESPVED